MASHITTRVCYCPFKIPSSGWDITARVDVVSDFWRNTVNLKIDSKIKAGDISWDGKEILVKVRALGRCL